jgi:glycolate oxidase
VQQTVVDELGRRLGALLGRDRVSADPVMLSLHSYDASLDTSMPGLVVRPPDVAGLRDTVLAARAARVPYVVRGAGTGYSGGALAYPGGVVILTADLNQISDVDAERGIVCCQPGAVLAAVKQAAASAGWRYLPDPSSWEVCTIGGNVAENAGGPHALAKGSTTVYVMSVDVLLPDGTTATLDEQDPWLGGLDLRSLVVGAEGTLGIVTSVRLRLVRPPLQSRVALLSFPAQELALGVIRSLLVDRRLSPSALDMLTGAVVPGTRRHDDSLLFVAFEGEPQEVAVQAAATAEAVADADGTFELLASDQFLQRRAVLVRDKVRAMVAASGCPRYYLFDAVTPRGSLAFLMSAVQDLARKHRLPLLNTFHAGDSNVHPTPFYDPLDTSARTRLLRFSEDVLRECASVSGALSGEHGIGLEKRDLMPLFFTPPVLQSFRAVKELFDPENLCNPDKIMPTGGSARVPAIRARWDDRDRQQPAAADVADGLVEVSERGTFADVAQALAGSGFTLPYEALGHTEASPVLAAINSGAPGLREPWIARARDLIVAALVERLDGSLLELGGRCTKDVSGYELRKLLFGADGRLGRVRSIRLRILPAVTDLIDFNAEAGSAKEAVERCLALTQQPLPFSYLGILGVGADSVSVVARLELRAGSFGAILARQEWKRPPSDSPWDAPPTRALARAGLASSLPWHPADERAATVIELAYCSEKPFFASVGSARVWLGGTPTPHDTWPRSLDERVAAIVRGG